MSALLHAALRHDLFAAMNRMNLHRSTAELRLLHPQQLGLYLELIGAKPGDDRWRAIEDASGYSITTKPKETECTTSP